MKRGNLLRHLRRYGCHLKREGRSVPRQAEIANRLAAKICRAWPFLTLIDDRLTWPFLRDRFFTSINGWRYEAVAPTAQLSDFKLPAG